uniref:Uncharacterized protein n=1 Tax=viral metagenome TaxID=1070528 RepID=A0A6M3ITJ2_9ZZZZ
MAKRLMLFRLTIQEETSELNAGNGLIILDPIKKPDMRCRSYSFHTYTFFSKGGNHILFKTFI